MHQARSPLDGLRVELGRDGAQLRRVGEDEVSIWRQMIRSRTGGQQRRPRLGCLGEITLLQPGEVLVELLPTPRRREVWQR